MGKFNIYNNPYFQTFNALSQAGLQIATAAQQTAPAFNTNVPAAQSFGGRPSYNLGQSVVEAGTFNQKDAGRGLITKGAMAGLQAGMNPAVMAAAPWAPVAGAAAGAITGAILQKSQRDKAEEMQNKRIANITSAQREYTKGMEGYSKQFLARQQYEDQFK